MVHTRHIAHLAPPARSLWTSLTVAVGIAVAGGRVIAAAGSALDDALEVDAFADHDLD